MNTDSVPTILLINGPNLDMLGKRDPTQYGTFTLADVEAHVAKKAQELGVQMRFFQSQCEGEICKAIHEAMQYAAGIVINAGAYTHYSYAILDAILLTKLPTMEVHISDIHAREAFRRVSVIQPACVGQVCGLGIDSYTEGLSRLVNNFIRKSDSDNSPAPYSLDALRTEITKTDAQIIALLRHRMDLASHVVANKAKTGKAVYDPAREAVVIANAKNLATAAYAAPAAVMMQTLMRLSREKQYDFLMQTKAEEFRIAAGLPQRADGSLANIRRVAFAGSTGSFSAQAAKALFQDKELIPSETFAEACDLVSSGRVDAAVLPLANTTGGPVSTVYRLISKKLHIIRSYDLTIKQCLAAPKGASLNSIRCVCSHPQALAQCSNAIHEHEWSTETFENTAFAATAIAKQNDPSRAAICSTEAATANQLEILVENLCDSTCNTTRFVVVSRELLITPDASRLGLLFQMPDRMGALAQVLNIFVDRSLNLSSICSQPMPDRPWEFAFFVDVNAPALDPAAISAVYMLSHELPNLRVIGWYGADA